MNPKKTSNALTLMDLKKETLHKNILNKLLFLILTVFSTTFTFAMVLDPIIRDENGRVIVNDAGFQFNYTEEGILIHIQRDDGWEFRKLPETCGWQVQRPYSEPAQEAISISVDQETGRILMIPCE